MKTLFLISILAVAFNISAADNRILSVDPYSVDSMEKNFPDAVETETIIDHSPKTYSKKIGPQTKELKKVRYEVLIPDLIKLIQEQQAEIERLKRINATITKTEN